MSASDLLLARALREESGLLVARLARRFGDFDLAEEAVQQAVVEALTTWRRDGPPDNPAAWLQVAARRNALDAVRRAGRQRGLAARAEPPGAGERPGTDDRLALLFACCHPALAPEARLALTLRAVVGLTTPQIARAFLVNETTLAQRIVRAKRKIVTAGISLTVPEPADLSARLGDVLAVVYVMFNEGFVSSTGATQDRDLAADAVWLAGVIATSLPDEPEAWGLAALLTLQHARTAARFDAGRRAGAAARPGPEPLGLRRAGHGRGVPRAGRRAPPARPLPAAGRHRRLPRVQPVVGGDRLAADRHPVRRPRPPRPVPGPAAQPGRRAGPARPGARRPGARRGRRARRAAGGYHLFHATRAALLTTPRAATTRPPTANLPALALTTNDAERRLLTTRLHRHPLSDGS